MLYMRELQKAVPAVANFCFIFINIRFQYTIHVDELDNYYTYRAYN